MNIILCCINWNAISAIANIAIALLALITYIYSRNQAKKQDALRFEDLRARLAFSIVDWHNHYMLKISNVGKETAYNVQLNVSGPPISENPFDLVKDVFARLRETTIIIESGQSVYYLISPTEKARGDYGIEGGQQINSEDIIKWLRAHDKDNIIITGLYNDRFLIKDNISIRDYLQYGAFEHKNPLEEIADAMISRSPEDKNIQKNIQQITNFITKCHNG